jgi:autotransporter-associated beta strand protein
VTLVSNTTITTNNSTDSLTISGAIGGSGTGSGTTLTTAGPGLVVLSANNTYSGGTSIGGGTLRIGNGGTSGTLGAGPITDNGILAFDRSDNAQVISTSIVGSGIVAQVGTGMTTLSGSNSYGGGTNINAGILEFPQPGNMPGTGTVAVAGGATLAVGAGGASGWTSAQIDAFWNGTGNVSWASGGILGIDSTNATGGTFTYASNITDGNGGTTPMGLAAIGSGTLVLSGTNSFSGGLYLDGGIVSVGSDANLGASTGAITFNGGTLQMTSAFNPSATRPITVDAGGGTIDATGTITIGSNISGAGGINLNNSGVTLILSGNNSFAGGISNPGNGTYYTQTIQLNGANAGGTGTISFGNDFAQQNITLNLRSDTSATFSPASVVFNQTDDYTGSTTTINVGPLTTATNQTLTLNSVTAPSNQSPGAFIISGSAGYTLGINTLTMPQTNTATINANTNVQIGTLNWTPYSSNGVPLTLQGTAGGTVGLIHSNGGSTMGGIEVAGGTWTLTGANSFGSGPWTANGNYFAAGGTEVIGASSVLVISNDLALGTVPSSPTNGVNNIGLLNGGTLRANGSFTLNANRGIGIGLNTGSAGDTGTIDVASGQTLTYNGIIASSGTTGVVNLITTPSGGTLILGGTDAVTGTTTVAGGTLDLVGTSNISGAAIVAGGTLVLGGTNNVSGAVTVNAGTLRVNGSLGSGSAVSVGGATPGASGTPTEGGSGTINGSLTVSGSGMGLVAGHIAPSGYISAVSPPSAPLNLAGALTLNGGSALDFNLSNSTSGANDQISITGSGPVNYGTGGVLNINAYQSNTLAYGTYVLINNTSSGTLSGGSGWTIGANTGASPLQSDSVAVVGNNLDLIVGAVSVYWTGANTSWDTNPSNTTSWMNAGGTANAFATGMAVTFGDTYPTSNTAVASSGGNVQVTIQDAGVLPGSTGVTFTNSVLNYTITNATPLTDTVGIGGTTGLTLTGTKNVTLAGANSFSGAVAVNSGQLILANGAALGNTSGVTVASGAGLSLQSGNGNSESYGLTAADFNAITTNIVGTGSGSGAFVNISGNNSYGGAITLTGAATIGSTSTFTGDGLTLSGGINNGGNLLTFSGAGNTTVSSMGISGAGGLTQNSSGTLTLASNNGYSGLTQVNAGTLRITGSLTSPTGVVNVGGASATEVPTVNTTGGTPSLAGGGTITGSVEIFGSGSGAAGHLAPSAFNGTSATFLTINGNLTLDAGAVLDFNLSSHPDGLNTSGPVTLPPSGYNDYVNVLGSLTSSGGGTLNINDPNGLNAGTYVLAEYGSGAPLASDWGYTLTNPQPGLSLTFSTANPGQFDLVATTLSSNATWISPSNGNYNNGPNWSTGTVPSGAGLVVTFGAGGQSTVSINSGYTIGQLNFNNGGNSGAPTSYFLTGNGSGSLTLNNSGNGASVNVSGGSLTPTLGANLTLTLADSSLTTTFNIASGSSLEVGGPINQTGGAQKVVLAGGGTLELASPNTYTGATTINANGGTLQIVGPSGSIASTSISVGVGGTLQLAGTTGGLPNSPNITTHGTGTANDGALVLTGTATETVGTVSGDTSTIVSVPRSAS